MKTLTTPVEKLVPKIVTYLKYKEEVSGLDRDQRWLASLVVGIVEERADKYSELKYREDYRSHQINAACNNFNILASDYEEIKRRSDGNQRPISTTVVRRASNNALTSRL